MYISSLLWLLYKIQNDDKIKIEEKKHLIFFKKEDGSKQF
jgi:hypothetical protein